MRLVDWWLWGLEKVSWEGYGCACATYGGILIGRWRILVAGRRVDFGKLCMFPGGLVGWAMVLCFFWEWQCF